MTMIQLVGDQLIVQGSLTMDTVALMYQETAQLMPSNRHIQLNLQQISKSDSASLAYLTALLRCAKAKQSHLTFIHVPNQMLDLAKVSGLTSWLPLSQ